MVAVDGGFFPFKKLNRYRTRQINLKGFNLKKASFYNKLDLVIL